MLLRDRELHPFPMRLAMENALEDSFIAGNACKFDNPLPPSVSSTIAIAMSCDGQTFATTHGDHTVKVFDFISGEQVRVFRGHPRTPWTIKYHPTDPNIIASGCLGFEVCPLVFQNISIRFPSFKSYVCISGPSMAHREELLLEYEHILANNYLAGIPPGGLLYRGGMRHEYSAVGLAKLDW